MCAIFGFVNYRHAVNKRHLKELTDRLAVESEVRGTDASGIAYVKDGELKIYKKPKPAHKVRFYFPEDTTILTGHTRMATQGDARYNYNNHPFPGHTENGDFALCHNGVLYNDDELVKSEKLPSTKIKTDSYVAVQLIEKYRKLDFDTIAKMCEKVHGNFVFTILNDDNTLYLAKGDNPLCLVYFKQLGLYVYTSTAAIMQSVLKGSFLEKFPFEIINVEEGDIVKIDRNGKLEKDCFMPDNFSCYDRYLSYDYPDPEESYLFSICNMFGLSQEELILLYDMGYCEEEIELMLDDKELLKSALDEAKYYLEVR